MKLFFNITCQLCSAVVEEKVGGENNTEQVSVSNGI